MLKRFSCITAVFGVLVFGPKADAVIKVDTPLASIEAPAN
jgi:hypothetical protein